MRGPRRDRLTLVGAGVAAAGVVGVIADIVLPYGLGDFRFTDLGPLSTALFLGAVGYAVLRHKLFDLRLLVRKPPVLGILGSLALAAYGAVVVLAPERCGRGARAGTVRSWCSRRNGAVVVLAPERCAGEGSGTLTRSGVLVIALSFEPLQQALAKRVD